MVPERGRGLGNNVSERVVSQVLTELDGLESLKDVVVIATTNRLDMVDPAILRPGRIDRKLIIPLPDADSRKSIFEIHTKNKHLSPDLDIEKMLTQMDGFSGADIAALCNIASLSALREHIEKYETPENSMNHKEELVITREHFENAFEKVSLNV